MRLALFLFVAPCCVWGHGFLVNPTARNAVDKDLPIFHNGSQPAFPLDSKGTPGCYPAHGSCGCYCGNGTTPCVSGQSCFWFSQGCTIGCPTCDGVSPRSFTDLCGLGARATVCDARLRTYATDTACNSAADRYRFNPWRAPGTAPVFDACGKAGGGVRAASAAHPSGAAFFTNTSHNVLGDLGSRVLPPTRAAASWARGAVVEATWSMRANHGGGYQYRLCPAEAELTEACFAASPVPFVGNQALLFGNGTRQPINSAYVAPPTAAAAANGSGSVAYYTVDGERPPAGAATWARNPIPDNCQKGSTSCAGATEFPPPCVEPPPAAATTTEQLPSGGSAASTSFVVGDMPAGGFCSGERPFNVAIVDELQVPMSVAPGQCK
jgi:hypothetical protein